MAVGAEYWAPIKKFGASFGVARKKSYDRHFLCNRLETTDLQLRKNRGLPQKQHSAVLFYTKRRKYGTPLISEDVL